MFDTRLHSNASDRDKVLDEIKEIIDDAISGLYKGTEDPYSAHARHKAFSWVNMKIEELRTPSPEAHKIRRHS